MMKVRKATLSDEKEFFELLKKLISPQAADNTRVQTLMTSGVFREILQDESKGTILVAEEDGELVGLITLSYPIAIRCAGRYTCIEEFIVSETVRGRGVGTQLLESALNEAKKQGCYEIQVNAPSELGYPLYIKQDIKDAGKHLKKRLRE